MSVRSDSGSLHHHRQDGAPPASEARQAAIQVPEKTLHLFSHARHNSVLHSSARTVTRMQSLRRPDRLEEPRCTVRMALSPELFVGASASTDLLVGTHPRLRQR